MSQVQITINHTPSQSEFNNWLENGIFTHIEELPHGNVNYKVLVFDGVDTQNPVIDDIVNELNEYGVNVIEIR